jgi:hypothetical protein
MLVKSLVIGGSGVLWSRHKRIHGLGVAVRRLCFYHYPIGMSAEEAISWIAR